MITWRPVAVFAAGLVTLPLWDLLGGTVLDRPTVAWAWLGLLVLLLVVAGLVAVDVLRAADPAAVTMWRTGDRVVRLGGTAQVVLHIRNEADRPIVGMVRDAWPSSAGPRRTDHRLRVPAGATARVVARLTPERRGDRVAAGVTLRCSGPWGFAYRQTSRRAAAGAGPDWRLRVLPPFHARRHLPEKLARLRTIEGSVALRGRGQGTEFDALREYVPGDDVRSIDWRSTARHQTMSVRTWRAERDRRVLSVLDCGRTSAVRVGDEPRLDAQIEACLLLSAVAARAGDRVDALAVDTEVRVAVDGGRPASVLPRLITAMSTVQPALVETDFGLVVGEVLRRESKRALVVLFTSLEPGAITESLLPVLPQLAARHQVVVATVSDPEVARLRTVRAEPDDIYRAAAAEQALLERRRVTAALTRYGVEVLDTPADRFASDVADAYLRLKAVGGL